MVIQSLPCGLIGKLPLVIGSLLMIVVLFSEWIGAAIGAVATAVAAYYQYRENKKARHEQKRQYKENLRRQTLTYRMQQAQQAGIHPLAALGIDMGVNPMYPVGGDSVAELMAKSGQDIGRAVEEYATKEEKELGRLAIRQERAKAIGLEQENRLRGMHIIERTSSGIPKETGDPDTDFWNNQGQGDATSGVLYKGAPGLESQGNVKMVKPEVPYSASEGIQAGVEPFEKVKIDYDGFAWIVPVNPEDIEENAYLKTIYFGARGSSWAKNAMRDNPEKYVKYLPKLPENMVWRFRYSRGQFQKITRAQAKKEDAEKKRRERRATERKSIYWPDVLNY